jgi:hypothetical protein
MARLNVDGLHSVTVENGLFLIKVISGNALYEITIDPTAAALLERKLHSESRLIPQNQGRKMVERVGFQAIVGPNNTPGIELVLTDTLSIPILLGQSGIKALRACIAQIESSPDPN